MARRKPLINSNFLKSLMGDPYQPNAKEQKRLEKMTKSYNKKQSKLYNKLVRQGIQPHVATMIAGAPLKEGFIFKTQQGLNNFINRMSKRQTSAYQVAQKEKLSQSLITMLIDRLGVDPRKEGELQEYFASMTLNQWNQWLNKHWDYVSDIFEAYHAGMLGFGIYDLEESKYILSRLTDGKVKWDVQRQ